MVSQLFHDCERLQNISKYIVINGYDKAEHDERLHKDYIHTCRMKEKKLR